VHDTVKVGEEVEQRTEAVEGAVPVKDAGGRNSTQFALMVQPERPQVEAETGVGTGTTTAPAPATVKPLTTKLDPVEEHGTAEGHAAEPSSQDILPLQMLQTGTIPPCK